MIELNRHDLIRAVRCLPKNVRELLIGGGVFLAGGYLRSIIANEPVNDIDLMAPSTEAAGHLALTLAGGDPAKFYHSDNAYTIRGGTTAVQVIHRWPFVKPEDAMESFDFTIAKAAIWFADGRWQSRCHPNYYADLAAKRLVYTSPRREEEPGGSLLRVLKFYQRGYRIPLEDYAAVIARAVFKLDLRGEDEDMLEAAIKVRLREVDPLDRVHAAYFADEELPEEKASA
jgi:hypothetical protein